MKKISTFNENEEKILEEISATMNKISEEEIVLLLEAIFQSKRVFFIGVGRVLLILEAIAKRWAHLGIDTVIVGEITEPAITKDDLLIVGSGSGESLIPLAITKKAKSFEAKIAHIGANGNSSISQYADFFIQIPVQTKFTKENETASVQPMTSLFEQVLLILGDTLSLLIINRNKIDLHTLWEYHANLE
ncbi:6-phospho 3-hexuloisomerase [Enterococcus casseliflavus EC20]|uniref:6-phospho 3-hexuloisomerase n=2 Tax=Enterococcus casseliflavus TaxID=37734 RepID=C9AC46_ENTCA|nr:6-phospho-3-hexuloisomerase [Enterococcus casseliflavus]EEV40455.1 6-phospho 3-hexuloisomerase [Enterococcus casseliflavus EC20]